MFIPGIFDDDFFDDIFGFGTPTQCVSDKAIADKHANGDRKPARPARGYFNPVMSMKTDVKETDDSYELDVELPGYKKEDISVQLNDGNLTISAETKNENNDEKKDRYIRKERYYGKVSRSFYVGDALTEEDIKGKFEDGILKLTVPKKEKEQETAKYITIE